VEEYGREVDGLLRQKFVELTTTRLHDNVFIYSIYSVNERLHVRRPSFWTYEEGSVRRLEKTA
jgi:hypothetical protein